MPPRRASPSALCCCRRASSAPASGCRVGGGGPGGLRATHGARPEGSSVEERLRAPRRSAPPGWRPAGSAEERAAERPAPQRPERTLGGGADFGGIEPAPLAHGAHTGLVRPTPGRARPAREGRLVGQAAGSPFAAAAKAAYSPRPRRPRIGCGRRGRVFANRPRPWARRIVRGPASRVGRARPEARRGARHEGRRGPRPEGLRGAGLGRQLAARPGHRQPARPCKCEPCSHGRTALPLTIPLTVRRVGRASLYLLEVRAAAPGKRAGVQQGL